MSKYQIVFIIFLTIIFTAVGGIWVKSRTSQQANIYLAETSKDPFGTKVLEVISLASSQKIGDITIRYANSNQYIEAAIDLDQVQTDTSYHLIGIMEDGDVDLGQLSQANGNRFYVNQTIGQVPFKSFRIDLQFVDQSIAPMSIAEAVY
ncbi:hypothetical protein GYA49_05660 [Candidatus Beckwithbacteria bacterium]|nr:hypothetical protein [Candidatus Beckwithbacteria bacterium]